MKPNLPSTFRRGAGIPSAPACGTTGAMGLERIRGQDRALRAVGLAMEQGRFHHAYRFEGPEGVGKELTALSLAKVLNCREGRTLALEAGDEFARQVFLNLLSVVQRSDKPILWHAPSKRYLFLCASIPMAAIAVFDEPFLRLCAGSTRMIS